MPIFWRLLLLGFVAISMVACDATSTITMENHQNRAVQVSAALDSSDRALGVLPPCSIVKFYPFLNGYIIRR
jgi:hypothetical protein